MVAGLGGRVDGAVESAPMQETRSGSSWSCLCPGTGTRHSALGPNAFGQRSPGELGTVQPGQDGHQAGEEVHLCGQSPGARGLACQVGVGGASCGNPLAVVALATFRCQRHRPVREATGASDSACLMAGFVNVGDLSLRGDLFEKLMARLRALARRGSFPFPDDALEWLGCSREQLGSLLGALGYRCGSQHPGGPRPHHP